MPKVSVVIPAYNAARYLAEAITSALAQTFQDIEVIVVNDGSTDDTLAIARSFAPRVHVCSGPNRGLPAARNIGARAATGEWLAFLDADDVWCPQKLERQLAIAGDEAHLVYTERYHFGARGSLPERQTALQTLYEGDVFEDLLIAGNLITASSVVIRRTVFWELGGFCEHLKAAEDWDLWIRFAAAYQVRLCPEPLVGYRFHAGMMSGDPRKMQIARNRVIERALALPRGAALPAWVKRRIRAATWSENGWDATRHRRHADALTAYARSIAWWPFDRNAVKGLIRLCVGRP